MESLWYSLVVQAKICFQWIIFYALFDKNAAFTLNLCLIAHKVSMHRMTKIQFNYFDIFLFTAAINSIITIFLRILILLDYLSIEYCQVKSNCFGTLTMIILLSVQ